MSASATQIRSAANASQICDGASAALIVSERALKAHNLTPIARIHHMTVTGGDLCMHAHVGFLVQGRMVVEYADGCRETYQAPAAVVVAPGHDGWVEGDESAVLVQFDVLPL